MAELEEPLTMSNHSVAVYAGSFDPPTYGHLDLVERASRLFTHLVVGIGINPIRTPLLTIPERLELLEQICRPFENVEVASFSGLAIDYAHKIGARVIVRGLRAATDFEYELQIAHANADLDPDIDTVFLPTRTNYGFISASLVREIAHHGGNIERYAPPEVCVIMRQKYNTENTG
jgi:pantetheine-phosphate adenylyltransferase